MAENNSILHSVKFYEFGKHSLWLSIVHNKQWNRYSLDITRKFTYTKDGETKEGSCSTYLNLTATKALVEQLPLAYQLAKNFQDNQGVKIYNIYCLISKYVIHFHTGQAQVTANDSADGVFGDIAAAGATSAWNIANFVMDGCGLTHAGANLQRSGNLGDGTGPLYASSSDPVSRRRPANAGVPTPQRRRLPKEDADKINKEGCKTDPRTNKRAKVSKWAVSKAAAARADGKKTKRVSKSDDVFDGGRRDVDKRTGRDLDDADDELY